MADYYGMTSIDTAVVSDTGDLLIGLTDGNIINAGYVRGRPGPQGERGLMGPAGDPGRNGLDGAQLYTGLGKPADDMGVEGDLYIDLRSRFLDIFQKTGGTWLVISSLRDPSDSKNGKFQPGMGGTRPDAGGGGGSNVIINNDLDGPVLDSEGNPIAPGMLWYNPDTGHLHVRSANNLEWIPIAGLPSAEFGPNPPTEDRGGHPLESGDLWWDSDQAALYTAVRNASDQLVWVIALPADRTGVPDEQPFVLPFAVDGRIETNPNTGIRYVYNAAKNQWVDIPTTGNSIFYQEDPPTLEDARLGIGDVWVKESDKQVYVFNGVSWDEARARPKVYTSDTAPTDPGVSEGELWWDSNATDLTLYIRYNDNWIPAAPPVSLDGIENSISLLQETTSQLQRDVATTVLLAREEELKVLDLQESQVAQDTKIEALEEDQERQDEKIAELEGEVDDLKPTVERGEWIYNSAPENKNNPEVGEYHAYVVVSDDYCKSKLAECLLNAAGDPILASECAREDEDCLAEIGNIDTDVPWHDVEWLVVHRNDSEGKSHTFGDVVAGMYIEAINVDGTGHGLYTINGKSLSPTRCGFQVTPVHSTGHPNGKAVIKIFSMAEAANPEDYVMKSGDTMTGRLTLERPRTDENGNSFRIKGRINGEEGANLLKDYQRATDSTSSDYIDYFGGSPNSTSLINRGYVDDLKKYIFAPARYEWQARISSSGAKCPVGFVQFSGKSFADSNEIRISMTSFCKNFVMSKDGMTDQKTLYEREQGYNSAMVISAYFYKNNEWKWKGTSEIRKIIIMDQGEGFNYLKLALDNQKYANGDLFTDTHYYLTISGLF